MYDEIYKVWKLEAEQADLEKLPAGFYSNVAEYMKRLREEGRMLDKRTLKTSLLKKELQNARLMIQGLVQIRYHKVLARLAKGEEIGEDALTPEERMVYSGISPFSETIRSFAQDVIRGQAAKPKIETRQKRMVLRFVKEVPGIIGADMKTYGPFEVEDVAALPAENTRILIKQGLAEKVQVN